MNNNIDTLVPSKERIHGPDVVRGLAAIGVVFFHVLYLCKFHSHVSTCFTLMFPPIS